jgi:hypothetical protein
MNKNDAERINNFKRELTLANDTFDRHLDRLYREENVNLYSSLLSVTSKKVKESKNGK